MRIAVNTRPVGSKNVARSSASSITHNVSPSHPIAVMMTNSPARCPLPPKTRVRRPSGSNNQSVPSSPM
jgi:hypothetical protein